MTALAEENFKRFFLSLTIFISSFNSQPRELCTSRNPGAFWGSGTWHHWSIWSNTEDGKILIDHCLKQGRLLLRRQYRSVQDSILVFHHTPTLLLHCTLTSSWKYLWQSWWKYFTKRNKNTAHVSWSVRSFQVFLLSPTRVDRQTVT